MTTIISEQAISGEIQIAIVVSHFNEEITKELLRGALKRLQERTPQAKHLVVKVPGVVEIPLVAQQLAKSKRFDAIIALGAVVRGETSHYDYVCKQVSDGCQKVALENGLPVVFGILTTENEEQAFDRLGGAHGHKGMDAVDAAYAMVSIMSQLA